LALFQSSGLAKKTDCSAYHSVEHHWQLSQPQVLLNKAITPPTSTVCTKVCCYGTGTLSRCIFRQRELILYMEHGSSNILHLAQERPTLSPVSALIPTADKQMHIAIAWLAYPCTLIGEKSPSFLQTPALFPWCQWAGQLHLLEC